MPDTSSNVLTRAPIGPRKAEAIRRLEALAAVVGPTTQVGWIIAGIERDHAGHPADWRAEVLAVLRILLGEPVPAKAEQ